jgi:adenylyltransferase/sulfurtransferase
MSAPDLPGLDDVERSRYARHLILEEVGPDGQRRLKGSSVLLVGAGGLGAPVAAYLTAAGVGRLTIVDFDRVDDSNLQRQVLFSTADVGRPKVEAARERLRGINPHVDVRTVDARFDTGNGLGLVRDHDVVIDGTDNFPTRYLVNDACVLAGRPNVYGSVFRFEGQASVFGAGRGPCYRCLHPEPPPPGAVPNCVEGGVLGVLPAIVGSIQATEAIKILLGRGEPLFGRLLLIDALELRFREIAIRRIPDCPVCGDAPSIRTLESGAAADACAAESVPEDAARPFDVTPEQVAARIARGDDLVLLDVRTPMEWSIVRLDGAVLIPMNEVPARLDEIGRDRDVVVYCHHGPRSSMVTRYLREHGFPAAANLDGGIDAWARTVDSSLPRY